MQSPTIMLETERLLFRRLVMGDFDALFALVSRQKKWDRWGTVIFERDGSSPQIIGGTIYGVAEWTSLWSGDADVWLSLQPSQAPAENELSSGWQYRDFVTYNLVHRLSDVVQLDSFWRFCISGTAECKWNRTNHGAARRTSS